VKVHKVGRVERKHASKPNGQSYRVAVCEGDGEIYTFDIETTDSWELVTCLRCLKKRGARKGK